MTDTKPPMDNAALDAAMAECARQGAQAEYDFWQLVAREEAVMSDIETEFRNEMFGDLKVIRFILDGDKRSFKKPDSDVFPVPLWGDILREFAEHNWRYMTRDERRTLTNQVATLTKRVSNIARVAAELERRQQ